MKYVIDVPEEMITSSGELLFHYKNTKDLTYQMYTGINVIPYTEPDEIKNNKVNLCSSCELYKEHFPECGDVNVLFGDGVINDNICCCSGYVAKNEDEIRYKVEKEVWEFAGEFYNADSEVETLFGCDLDDICKKYTYSEAKAKYDQWKADKGQIRVGYEIEQITNSGNTTGVKCVVLSINGDNDMQGIIYSNCREAVCSTQISGWWRKTGRYFPEVAELLKKIWENQ